MLQTYSAPREAFYDAGSQNFGLSHYLAILRRRLFYCLGAFCLVLLLGSVVTAIQRPIYEASGKVLVESQEIPTDLVKPTVTDTANQRIQVIQQRIMTRDNLLALVNKYGMFAGERQWMSGTQLIDLMRERTRFELVDSTEQNRANTSTIAFTLSFQYENPEVALKVANDFLTLVLNEDARNRTNRATETTNFLAHESQRLQGELTAIETQIAENKARSHEDPADTADPARLQIVELTKLKEELAQKASIYSEAHPVVKALRKKISAMEALVAKTSAKPEEQGDGGLDELERRQAAIEANLESTNKKLEEARLGEKLERDQQSERLQVIEQPVMPQKPVKPNRVKLLALSFILAIMAGGGAVFAAESLDGSVRHSHELASVSNGRLIVLIPYIVTRSETSRRRGRIVLSVAAILILLVAGVLGLVFFGPPIDLSWINQFWLDHLTRLSK